MKLLCISEMQSCSLRVGGMLTLSTFSERLYSSDWPPSELPRIVRKALDGRPSGILYGYPARGWDCCGGRARASRKFTEPTAPGLPLRLVTADKNEETRPMRSATCLIQRTVPSVRAKQRYAPFFGSPEIQHVKGRGRQCEPGAETNELRDQMCSGDIRLDHLFSSHDTSRSP